jgi:glycosyltransferase involved in cell wall biosynthesis
MSEPVLSAIVPTRNRAELLPRVLANLAEQQFPPDRWELIVVDDGSTDGTAEVVGRFMKDARMRVALIRQKNAGAGAARNAGAAVARGRRFLFLDDDMIASAALVAEHAGYTEDPSTSVIGRIEPPSSHRDPWMAWEDAQLAKLAAALAAGRAPGPRDFYSGNCSVPSALFHAVGGFDVTLARGEDFQLGFRLADHGGHLAYSQRALSTHLGAHSYAAWTKNAETFGRSEIVLRDGLARETLAKEAAGRYRQRNILNRAAVRFSSGNAALRRILVANLDAAGRAAHHVGLRAPANAAYSAVYNIFYWHGLIDGLGSDQFWRAVRRPADFSKPRPVQ